MNVNSTWIWVLIGQVALLCGLVMAVTQWRKAMVAAEQSRQNALTCRQLLRRIDQLAKSPSANRAHLSSDDIPAADIFKIAIENGLSDQQISSVVPHAPRQSAESNYLLQDFTISLQQATMTQIVRFAIQLESMRDSTTVTSLALHGAPRRGPNEAPRHANSPKGPGIRNTETWNAQLTLTHYIDGATRRTK